MFYCVWSDWGKHKTCIVQMYIIMLVKANLSRLKARLWQSEMATVKPVFNYL